MLTVAISKRNKLQNIIVLTPKDGTFQKLLFLPAKNVILHLRIIAQFFFFLYNYFLFVQKNNRFYHLFPFLQKSTVFLQLPF